MVGQDMRQPPEKVQLSAGDLLGRTHEELVLLLIQLRRQSSALLKARDACLLEMESQVRRRSRTPRGVPPRKAPGPLRARL